MLLRHLPRESSYIQAVVGETARWSDTEHLLAGVFDLLQVANYLTGSAHFKNKPSPPTPIARPGDKPALRMKPRTSYTLAELDRVRETWADAQVTEQDPEVR